MSHALIDLINQRIYLHDKQTYSQLNKIFIASLQASLNANCIFLPVFRLLKKVNQSYKPH